MDTRLVVDDGEVAIHWLIHVGADNVVLLPGCLYGDMKLVTSVTNTIVIEDNEVPDDV